MFQSNITFNYFSRRAFKKFINVLEGNNGLNTSVNTRPINPKTYIVFYLRDKKDDPVNASQVDLSIAQATNINNMRAEHDIAVNLIIQQLGRADKVAEKISDEHLDAQTEFILKSKINNLVEARERTGNSRC